MVSFTWSAITSSINGKTISIQPETNELTVFFCSIFFKKNNQFLLSQAQITGATRKKQFYFVQQVQDFLQKSIGDSITFFNNNVNKFKQNS